MMKKNALLTIILILSLCTLVYGQKPYRVGTTAANFLEVGVGASGTAMGDAHVGMVSDLTSIYWNPAGLGFMERSEILFMHQPWLVDINTMFAGAGLVLPNIGTLAAGVFYVDFGEMEVTTLDMQEGTGEKFSPSDFAFSFSFSRRLVQWFSFGATVKYISSQIWHTSASAMAIDLGVIVNTNFLSPTDRRNDGMKIGMSISNYGTRMKYDGMDLMRPLDILPNEEGNYRDAPARFQLRSWELPLVFRVGVALSPIVKGNNRLTLSVDALHPNNNAESVNIGGEYKLIVPGFGDFYLRGGYKALFLVDSQHGLTLGGGILTWISPKLGFKIDYAYRDMDILGNIHCYNFGMLF